MLRKPLPYHHHRLYPGNGLAQDCTPTRRRSSSHHPRWAAGLFILLAFCLLPGCSAQVSPAAAVPTRPPELVLYDWENDMPLSVLEQFEQETGVRVIYQTYQSQGDAIDDMRAGHVYDVVVMESRYVPMLAQAGLLATLRHENIPNFRNISPNFRDLDYDPSNKYCVPYSYGTTGLLVRTDLTTTPVNSWKALWDERYRGRVAVWRGEPQEVIGITLRALGYPANSTNPDELEQARLHLLDLAPHVLFTEDYDPETAAEVIIQGAATISMGYAYDYATASEQLGQRVSYVLPDEGALLWGDTFVIPANSDIPGTAEQFINFILRADVNAEVVNYNHYATANEAALELIDPGIRSNAVIFPPNHFLLGAEIIFPISGDVQVIHDRIWQDFLAAAGQ